HSRPTSVGTPSRVPHHRLTEHPRDPSVSRTCHTLSPTLRAHAEPPVLGNRALLSPTRALLSPDHRDAPAATCRACVSPRPASRITGRPSHADTRFAWSKRLPKHRPLSSAFRAHAEPSHEAPHRALRLHRVAGQTPRLHRPNQVAQLYVQLPGC